MGRKHTHTHTYEEAAGFGVHIFLVDSRFVLSEQSHSFREARGEGRYMRTHAYFAGLGTSNRFEKFSNNAMRVERTTSKSTS